MKMERPLRRSSLSTLHAKLHPPKRRSICLNRQVKGLMRKKQTTTNLDERFSLSGECQDLLSRCLNLSEVHRATLQQILEHEWFQVQLEPKPPCPLPQHKALPTPHGFTGQYEKGESLKFGRMWSCTRKVDGQNFIMKHSEHSGFDPRVFLADYNRCMDTEVGLNVVMKRIPSSHGVLLMESAVKDTLGGHILVFRHPGPCKSLKKFLKCKGGRVSEHMAREFMVQAAMAVKDCIDRGVYHEDITLGNFLVNTETRQLLLHNFSKGQLVDTEYDSSLYRGKALPVEFKKRERYLAEASVVSALGCMLYTMVNGGRPRVTKRGCGTDKLTFRSSLSTECQDLIIRCLNQKVIHRATIQELLEHEWFQVDLPDHREESGFFVQLRKWQGRMM
ncbi:serine/threonine-protein kinase pim-3-like [Triplophysa rosa]|uniref:serine/threonine-protein kinase pim-3-like n=1 Tax=Triplophysa rosa TaxID=992332 RepID=UPI0025462447|nr:serine/threonine-protein kinase pim-3-like [Triplophysa rosa]XP_057191153.1 serine/threonine-protein kinase pim-3-like [Triplophysa rosa]